MSEHYLDAGEIAHVAHDAVYRAWFRLGCAVMMSQWEILSDGVHREARDAVSSRIRGTYKNERVPTSIPAEYGEFWKSVVDAAIRLSYDDSDSNGVQP